MISEHYPRRVCDVLAVQQVKSFQYILLVGVRVADAPYRI
jgi:hypothetical protein